mmetsp:Transcript_41453/g.93678  ORF Transcript_41453/g.93678 Transcript_41453/m.93678 type:complete len:110 (-) Transcript_41453:153-482(-)
MAALTSGEGHGHGDDGDDGDGGDADLDEVARPEVGFDPTRTTDETPEPTAADLSPEFAALAAAGVALQAHAAAGPADEEARLATEKDVAEAAAVLEQLEADEAAMLGGS